MTDCDINPAMRQFQSASAQYRVVWVMRFFGDWCGITNPNHKPGQLSITVQGLSESQLTLF
ncbi:hypothetical protein OUZ56_012875 [Daphnia magna]|uniref:Uncharacterized protein n=1 Tax=Daphnia magna TaxID=35525 RepID=A0ABQ9Z4A8_9CRUS|nr:hypothetical protein OUZ56_012875 [Daphnia magna]